MEDRKRPLHDQADTAPPSKKQATSANGAGKSHRDNDMPWKDELETIQKDAIQRQMQEYKRERNTLESTLKEIKKKARDHDDHIRTIDAWLKQLVDEIKLLIPANGEEMDVDSVPSSLLFADQQDFKKHLESRAADIRSLVSRLFSRTEHFTPEVSELQNKVSQLLASEKEHVAELERLRTEVKDLDDRLQNASLRYMVAEKKLDRMKSATAAKVDKGELLGGAKSTTEDSGQVKREDSTANGAADHGEELVELEQEVKKATAAYEKQKEQIAQLEEENAKLTAKVTELATKSLILTDDDYAKTELFKQLKAQRDDVVKKINDLDAANSELKEENAKFQSERTAFQSQLEAESRSLIAEKEAALSQTQTDLARIRCHRDELLADQAIRKASIDDRSESLRKLKDLTSAQEERIKALESENERLSTEAGSAMAVTSELDSMGAEDLRTKYQELEKKYQLLNGELASMSTAFQKTSKLASQKVSEHSALEEKVARLSAEKSKADQKYFAAMKSKETRDNEIRTLRMQNTKSSEVVAQLKDAETASRALLTNLEKQLTELRAALATKINEHRNTSQQSTTQASEIARLSSQLTEIKQQMTAKDSKLASTSSACRSAEVEVEELKSSLADTRRNLESWKNKSGQSEQYEMLRTFAYCNICKKELKNTVIKTCGHTFCNSCVEERLTSRSRKCPNCGKSFGSNDHMRITL